MHHLKTRVKKDGSIINKISDLNEKKIYQSRQTVTIHRAYEMHVLKSTCECFMKQLKTCGSI